MEHEYQIHRHGINGYWHFMESCGTDLEFGRKKLAAIQAQLGQHFRLVKATFEVIGE
jgi:hypothetical protein